MNKRLRICLGVFAGAHGVKGEAKIKTFTESERNIAYYGPVEGENGERRFTLKFLRVLKPGLALVTAPEIESREDAMSLKGTRLYVDRDKLPEPEDDAFYFEDLVGLAAVDDEGSALGRIVAVHDFGAGPVIEISDTGGKSVLAPFTRAVAPVVDVAGGRITISAAALVEIDAGDGG